MKAFTMKKSIFFTALILLITSSISAQNENSTQCSKRNKHTNSFKSATLSVAQIAQTEKYDVNFYSLDLSLTNISTNISGTGRFDATSNQFLDTILYELYPSLVISDVKINGMSVPFVRTLTAVKVAINIPANVSFSVSTAYSGTPPTAVTNPLGGGGITYDTSPSWGNHVVWTLSEPFSAYEWFPCKQSLTDKADSCEVKITVPDTCKAGSNGILEQIIPLGNGFTRYEWKHRHAIDYYLISLSVAKYIDYTIYANPVGAPNPIMIQNYIYDNPATLPNFQADIDETAAFIELFYSLYGPYPFEDEKYGHCMAPISGGMEHQTMTTQGFFNNTLTAHELAHQWFGDNVTCKSWCDIWVNEGFASYSEYLMLENLYAGQEVQSMLDVHDNVMTQNGGSVWVLDSLNENRIFSGRLTYDKGSAIIHTIRYMVNNDSLFFATLRDFQNTYANSTAYGIDIRNMFQSATGIDFTPFFEQWYFGEGYPTYSVKWEQAGLDALVQINHSTSKPGVTPTFTNPISLRFLRQGMQDTTITFDINSNSDNFYISNLGPIGNMIYVDPANWVINKVGTVVEDNSLSIQENETLESIQVVPNPNNGHFKLVGLKEDSHLEIYSMNGVVVKEMNLSPSQNIDISSLPQGTYLLSISNSKGNKTLRLVTQK